MINIFQNQNIDTFQYISQKKFQFDQRISRWLSIDAPSRNFSANFTKHIYQNGVLFVSSANKCCYINPEHVTKWFA